MHYTYVLQSEQHPERHYIGSTDDLKIVAHRQLSVLPSPSHHPNEEQDENGDGRDYESTRRRHR